jgi:hypothetical protein
MDCHGGTLPVMLAIRQSRIFDGDRLCGAGPDLPRIVEAVLLIQASIAGILHFSG